MGSWPWAFGVMWRHRSHDHLGGRLLAPLWRYGASKTCTQTPDTHTRMYETKDTQNDQSLNHLQCLLHSHLAEITSKAACEQWEMCTEQKWNNRPTLHAWTRSYAAPRLRSAASSSSSSAWWDAAAAAAFWTLSSNMQPNVLQTRYLRHGVTWRCPVL